ncbi:hypothetical protein AAB992_01170 [Burkholderia contaminans]|uniref:hypothetical protein n=1 Tax=Burkholderia contaminans TaxID=488447 RepID=UPI002416624B|nr:hypothetical protein [Burkholderia contaminans]WFN14903.1 hypothetical protein LXE92_32270 [Burkholderia contaminans]
MMAPRFAGDYLDSIVIELMADGKMRTASEICAEVSASIGQMRRTLLRLIDRGEIHVCGFSSVSQARIYKAGIHRAKLVKSRVRSRNSVKDDWIPADLVVEAAMFAMINQGR